MIRLVGVVLLFLGLSGCRAEEWSIADKRGMPSANFWGRVVNFDGNFVTGIDNYPLDPAGTTRITLTTSPPVFEVKDVTVIAWLDSSGTRACSGPDCRPLDADPVVTLTGRNWPFVYDITFTSKP